MMASATTDYDIVIAGGGMVGSCAAIALASIGVRIAVVEAIPRSATEQPSFDDRTTALSRSSQRMFEALGLWPEIAAAATPIRHIHVSDQGRFGFSHIDARQQGVEALGHVVINRVLGDVLQSAVEQAPAIDFLAPASARDVVQAPECVKVSIRAGEAGEARDMSCHLLVAADGARSAVRERLGVGSMHKDYGQTALVGNVRTEKRTGNRAYERFTGSGPLAMLPVDDYRAGFIWTLNHVDAARVLGLDDTAFLAELQSAFGFRLGEFSRVGIRKSYPLHLCKALRVTAGRSVLVGNAAHGLHPVAAQGFNLGLRDVAALCDCVADAAQAGNDARDIGSPAMLERYAEWRRHDQQKLVHFTDGLVGLFRARRGPASWLRNAGMLCFDLVPGVREEFARHTMGLAGSLPRLSRGVPLS